MDIGVEEIRAQVERLIRSKAFETSEIHRRLLQYLADKALSGEADRLKEYTIGLEAFGKPDTYDPRHDSIVRLQVGRLRQKLAAYYQSEAGSDDLVISLPKGGFKLDFQVVQTRTAGDGAAEARRTRILAVALALALVWAIVATVLFASARRAATAASPWTPEMEALWAPFLESNRSLLLCLGAPLFVRIPNYGFFRDPRSNDWEEISKSDRIAGLRKALGGAEISPSYSFTGTGEASAGVLLSELLATRKHDLLLTRSNLLSWQQISDHDVIFIGPPKFNRQLQEAALTQDIVVESDGIRNLKPHPGEPEYLADHIAVGKLSEGETHALITRIPGLAGVGEFLMIAGNASPDTLAAAEWLTQPWRAKELVARLRTPSGEIPRYFQVVVKVVFKQGIPVESSYVFHHALQAHRSNAATPGK
ncbi:MAG TPA: hypothetical protein VE959_36665 [Bryobacteraceae bacterium]|nr:hypothetical protein [Bryobacteraceae bacterium]